MAIPPGSQDFAFMDTDLQNTWVIIMKFITQYGGLMPKFFLYLLLIWTPQSCLIKIEQWPVYKGFVVANYESVITFPELKMVDPIWQTNIPEFRIFILYKLVYRDIKVFD